MSETLEELVIKLDADLSGLKKELAKGESAVTKSAGKMSQGMGKVGESMQKARGAVNKYGTVAVAAFGAATAAIVKSQIAQVDALAKTSDEMGIAIDKLIGLQHAAEISGVSAGAMEVSIRKMTRTVGQANQGLAMQRDALETLNLSVGDLINLSPDEQFKAIAAEIVKLPTKTEQATTAMDIFGRQGSRLLNLMNSDFESLIDEAGELGLTISRLDAAKIEAANDAMTRAKAAFTGAARTLTVEFAPVIEAVADRLVMMSKDSDGFGEAIKAGFNNAVKAVGVFADGLRGIEVIFTVLQIAGEGFMLAMEVLFAGLQEGALAAANTFRSFAGLDPLEGITTSITDNLVRIEELKGGLQTLLTEPLPSEGLQETMNEIATAAEEAAGRVAAARNNALLAASGQAPEEGSEGEEGAPVILSPQEQLDAIAIQNELELGLLKKKQTDEQAVIDTAFTNKAISEKKFLKKSTALRLQHNKDTENMEKAHQTRLLKAQKFSELQSVNSFLKNNSDTLSAAASFAGDSFKVTKQLNLASAIVDTAAGVSRALALGPAGFPAAAAIAIKGAAQIKTIRGQSLGGGGGGGSSAVGSAPPTAQGPIQSGVASGATGPGSPASSTVGGVTTIKVELPEGDGMFTDEQVRNLLDQISTVEPNFTVETV